MHAISIYLYRCVYVALMSCVHCIETSHTIGGVSSASFDYARNFAEVRHARERTYDRFAKLCKNR